MKKILKKIGVIFFISILFWGGYHLLWITSEGPYSPPGLLESYLVILSMTIIAFLFAYWLNKKTEKEKDALLENIDYLTSFQFLKRKKSS